MLFRNTLSALALAASTFAQQYPRELVYQFDNAFSGVGYVNVENIAVRQSNGQLLLNLVTGAIMAQLNPDAANPQAELLVNISSAYPGAPGSLTGIAQTGADVYTVAAGDFIFGPQVQGGIAGVPGSFSIWNVDLSGHEAKAYKVVDIPEAGALNGLIVAPGSQGKYSPRTDKNYYGVDEILVADSGLGAIWKVNIKTGQYSQYLASPLFQPQPYLQLGINGLKYNSGYLYFTNSALFTFGAVKLNSDGTPGSDPQVFAQAPNGSSFDDFSFDKQGAAYIASNPNSVFKVSRENPAPVAIAQGDDLLTPTATIFRGENELFVTTGGQGGPMPQSGQVFRITVPASSKKSKRWFA